MTQTGSYTSQQMQAARQTDLQIRRSQTDEGNDFFFFGAAGILLNSCSAIHGNTALACSVTLEEQRVQKTSGRRVDAGIHTRQRETASPNRCSVYPGDMSIFILYHSSDCQRDDSTGCCVPLMPLFPLEYCTLLHCLVWINSWLHLDALIAI